ncbi:hypothetical protein pqer_cds_583 [Pandoravirus quercus]|uniref:DUF5878 domain-containing protein n=1 Tax=Pandoravirus quercus TaxID=2107709 RepID=A0A2U7U9E3_9VIRU|nr:hypothetical protein pqer_cds_583 [Pandoravirus quercus]AVK75005.1 hypothetical protein pqer_cds_583 [Pandoravirus quercus]
MERGSHRRHGGRGSKRRRPSRGKAHARASKKAIRMAATATSKPAMPQDRETLWKMHVHRAVTAGASTVCRPAKDNGPKPHVDERPQVAYGDCVGDDNDETDAAFVQIALDVLDDRGVLCARVVPGMPATIEMGPHKVDALWGPLIDRALLAAMASAPPLSGRCDRPPTTPSVEVDAIYATCCKDLPANRRDFASLGPRAQAALRALITARADSLSLCATQTSPLICRLARKDPTVGGIDAVDPAEEDPIYGGPGIGWALFKAYAIAIVVIIPLAMALCMGGD